MNVENYDIEDFACDHSFQEYCREENESSVAFWTEWIDRNPEKAQLILEARQLVWFLSAGQGNRQEQLDHLKQGLRQRDLLEAGLGSVRNVHQSRKPRKTYLTAIAACFAAAVIGYLFYTKDPLSIFYAGSRPLEYSSTALSRKTVVLSDGSVITLNKNSSITLSPQFSKTKRELTLSGEGFFEVSHDAEHPFFVRTDEVTVKVLGTTFNISAYPQAKNETETVLFEGKVEVTLNAEPSKRYILKPNDKFITRPARTAAAIPDISLTATLPVEGSVNSAPKETAWLRNRLELDNERLEVIADRLEKWYGIEIAFEDSLPKSYRYSGTFESETVVRALEALQLSYPFKIKHDNEKIIISK